MSATGYVLKNKSGGLDQHGTLSGKWVYHVTVDNPADQFTIPLAAIPVSIGDQLATGIYSYCTGKDANCICDDGLLWEVVVTFGNPDNNSDLPPYSRPAEYSWTLDKGTRIAEVCADGTTAIVNSAGMPFSDPVEIEDFRPVYQIKKSYSGGYDKSVYLSYRNSCNNATWNGGAAKVWRLSDMNITSHNDKKYGYYEDVCFSFLAAPYGQTWQKVIADMGLYYKVGGALQPIKVGGKMATEPQWLNGSGGLRTGSATYLTFEVLNALDYSIFNIT